MHCTNTLNCLTVIEFHTKTEGSDFKKRHKNAKNRGVSYNPMTS